ncbi:conserved protein of unknown function [Magnetospirillum sp. XM-1]|uniref:head-tail joining protein n=1 Tax=Magnetospirillum sp. XM-1 TaxID=1663591 RepID=UPI00073DF371|nr:hypothetical protein [Magnetospirillum sp. XM-1]CUW39678.1 conserved protein of unknown function [Magnetospirillum sp. XM-1]
MAVEDADDLAAFFDTDDFALSAVYRVGGTGAGVAIAVLPARADRSVSLFGQDSVTDAAVFKVRVAEVQAPAEGDTITVDGTLYTVQGVPKRDDSRAIWTVEAREE